MLHEIDPGPHCPEVVRMIVEIPKNSSNKYEFDTELGVFRLDRALYSPMHYPGDYGFIPGTVAEDGDPMDVLTMVDDPSFTGCLIEVRPIGLLDMSDENGTDQKIIAVPEANPRFAQIHTVDQLSPHVRRELEHSSTIKKNPKGSRPKLRGCLAPKEARKVIPPARHPSLAAKGTAEKNA